MNTALAKIHRASTLISDLNKILKNEYPFRYVLSTDTVTGERRIFVKRNLPAIEHFTLVASDALHNLRSALDHAFWEIVSPHARTEGELKKIQFPFSENSANLEVAVTGRLSRRVSDQFFEAIIDLKPCGGMDGNKPLYLIHELDLTDKHRTLIPTEDQLIFEFEVFRREVPDFPRLFSDGTLLTSVLIEWKSRRIAQSSLGNVVPPFTTRYERPLDIPVAIALGAFDILRPYTPTLTEMCHAALHAVKTVQRHAK